MNRQATIHASMDAVMQAFLETPSNQIHLKEHCSKIEWLRDYRTVGFFIPRQCGGTSWILKQIIADPSAILFTKYRDNIVVNFDADGVCDVMGHRKSILPMAVQARLYEAYDLSEFVKQGILLEWPTKLLIIDNSSVVFNNIRINKFHDWLEQSPGVTKDTVIVRIN
jgi:hypothetical protein